MSTNSAYEQFVNDFMEAVERRMEPETVKIDRNEMSRIHESRDFISVRVGDSMMAPVIYLDNKYQLYQAGYSVDDLARVTVKTVKEAYSDMPPMPELTREAARENLYCAVINTERNKEMLKNVPHEQLEDLSVVARFRVSEDGSFVISNALCERLQMTPEEVLEQAHINTGKTEFLCRDMCGIVHDCLVGTGQGDSVEAQLYDGNVSLEKRMYVLTNKRCDNGAAAITSQRTLDQAYLQLGEDYYILPSSRHEVILVPESSGVTAKELQAMVKEVNRTSVSEKDWLSDNVYFYKGETKTFSLADSPMLSKDVGHAMDYDKICGRKH